MVYAVTEQRVCAQRKPYTRAVIALASMVLVPALNACSWLKGGESNIEPPAALVEFRASATVKETWSRDIGAGAGKYFLKLQPSMAGTTIYTTDSRGRVSALEKETGRLLWEARLKNKISAGVGLGDGLVLVGTAKGELIALAQDSGKRLWTASLSSEILSPPAVDLGTVVAQTVDGKVFALSATDGQFLWRQERSEPALSLRGTSAPLAIGGIVLTGFASGKLAAFQLKDGHVLWEIPVAEQRGRSEIERLVDVDVQPLVVDKLMYAAAYQGKLIAFNLENGRIVWSRDISAYSGMDADTSNIYITDDKGTVLALDIHTGATVWKQEQLHGRALSAPVVTGDYIAVGDFEGYVHWLARADGQFAARYRPARAAVLVKPVADSAQLYVYSQNGSLSALHLVASHK